MVEVTDAPTNEPTVTIQEPPTKFHIVFMHKKLRKLNEDRYIIDMAKAAQEAGHKVTIFTTECDDTNCFDEVNPFTGSIEVLYSGWWIPRSFQILKSIMMAIRLIFFPPSPKPKVIIADTDIIAVYLLSKLTRYKTIFVNHFRALRQIDMFTKYLKITPDLWTAKMMTAPDEIIVQTNDIAQIFRRSYPQVYKELTVVHPCVDTGIWNEEIINIYRIIPDLPSNSFMFVCIGPYRRRSNFKLALDAFENLVSIAEKEIQKHLHLVIAGSCSENNLEQQVYYNELTHMVVGKSYGAQVTFLRQLPTVHKKTLINESIAVIIPAKYDIFPETALAAMSLKRPIIATDSGFLKGVVTHRISAILVDADPVRFAGAMHKVLTNPAIQAFISDMAKDVFDKDYTFQSFQMKMNHLMDKTVDDEVKDIYCRLKSE